MLQNRIIHHSYYEDDDDDDDNNNDDENDNNVNIDDYEADNEIEEEDNIRLLQTPSKQNKIPEDKQEDIDNMISIRDSFLAKITAEMKKDGTKITTPFLGGVREGCNPAYVGQS